MARKLKAHAQREADLAVLIAKAAWKAAAFDLIYGGVRGGEGEEIFSVLLGAEPSTEVGEDLEYTLHRMSTTDIDASLPNAPAPTRPKGGW